MTKAQPRPGEARTDVVSAGSGRVTGPAGPVTRGAAALWSTGWSRRTSAITLVLLGFSLAGAASNFTAGITVRAHLRATLIDARGPSGALG